MKVAVLISVYGKDNPQWVETALSSILDQNFNGSIQVYLGIDGKLTAELETVISKFNPRIHSIHRSSENLGLTKMLNNLIDLLEDEEFIFRADADDICHPERFQKQVHFLQEHPEVDVVGSAIEEIDETGKAILAKVSYPLTHDECLLFFKRRDPLAHPAVLFRRTYFVKAGKYNPIHRTNQDTYMWLQGFLSGCRFANLGDVLLSFRRSSQFYDRRGGLERAVQMLKLRWEISNKMGYPLDAYLYAIAFFLFTLMPSSMKRVMYQRLR